MNVELMTGGNCQLTDAELDLVNGGSLAGLIAQTAVVETAVFGAMFYIPGALPVMVTVTPLVIASLI
jgi:hypothetical protein